MKTHNTRQTSLWAYQALRNLSGRQAQVYQIIRTFGPISNLEIAMALGIPINQITPRTNELVGRELVEEAYKAKSPVTDRTVIMWRVR